MRKKQNKEKTLKILICYHKKDKLFKNDLIVPIHCGRDIALKKSKDGTISQNDLYWLLENMIGDNTGDNISSLNREVNELTAIYWAWKNYDKIGNPDYIGLMHYRRLFNLSRLFSCFSFGTTLQFLGLNSYYLKKLISKYDVITKASRLMKEQPFLYQFFQPFLNLSENNHPILYKEYLKTLDKGKMHTCSMFIMKKEDFFNMCEEIIPLILDLVKTDRKDKASKVIEDMKQIFSKDMYEEVSSYAISNNDIPRLYGFVSEYMIGLYLSYLEEKYKDSCVELPTYSNPSIKNKFKIILKNIFSISHGAYGKYKVVKILGFTIKIKK